MSSSSPEAAALSRLAADEPSALPGGIGDAHAAIAGRVFGSWGPLGAPARAIHDGVSRNVYVPETRPLARFLRRRSAGIRDLRHGSLVDADRRGRDPDALRARACEEIPLLEHAVRADGRPSEAVASPPGETGQRRPLPPPDDAPYLRP